jgi:hypothetical protein
MLYSVVTKLYSATIGLMLFIALASVAQAAANINPIENILWFGAFAIAVAAMYWIRDGHTFKVNTGEPSYYTRNRG